MQRLALICSAIFALSVSGCSMLDSVLNPYEDQGAEFPKRFYVGIGGGISRVAPDTSASSQYSLEDSMSTAATVTAGMDFSERLSFELSALDLGAASLAPSQEVAYQSTGLSAIYYAVGDVDGIANREGFAGFVRGGVNMMSHDSQIPLDSEDNVQILAGLGADYLMSNNFGIRAEIVAHDTDAQSAQLGLIYRFGEGRADSARHLPRQPDNSARYPQQQTRPQPRPQIQPRPVPRVEQIPQPFPQTAPEAFPMPPQQVPQSPSRQPNSAPLPVYQNPQVVPQAPTRAPAPRASVLADGILRGVDFVPRSTQMTATSGRVLDVLAREMIANQRIRVELQAYTDASVGMENAMKLARARVTRVGKYLIVRGVPTRQLGARAFGANRPRVADPRAAINNRIELRLSL